MCALFQWYDGISNSDKRNEQNDQNGQGMDSWLYTHKIMECIYLFIHFLQRSQLQYGQLYSMETSEFIYTSMRWNICMFGHVK